MSNRLIGVDAKIKLGKPHYYGYIAMNEGQHGWAMDLPFYSTIQKDDSREQLRDHWANVYGSYFLQDLPAYCLAHNTDPETIHWINGLSNDAALKTHFGYASIDEIKRHDWVKMSGSGTWSLCRPFQGQSRTWLYANAANGYCGAYTHDPLPCSWFQLAVYHYAPMLDTPYIPTSIFQFGKGTDKHYAIVSKKYQAGTYPAGQNPEDNGLVIYQIVDGVWNVLASVRSANRMNTEAQIGVPQLEIVTFRFIYPETLVIEATGADQQYIIHQPGLGMPDDINLLEGAMSFEVWGHNAAFSVAPFVFKEEGKIRQTYINNLPDWLSQKEFIRTRYTSDDNTVAQLITTTTVIEDEKTGSVGTQHNVIMSTTNPYMTPIVWLVTAYHESILSGADTEVEEIQKYTDSITVKEVKDGRENTASFTLKNIEHTYDDEWEDHKFDELKGNNYCKIAVRNAMCGQVIEEEEPPPEEEEIDWSLIFQDIPDVLLEEDTEEDPGYTTLMKGFLFPDGTNIDAGPRLDGEIAATVSTWISRLEKKTCVKFADVAFEGVITFVVFEFILELVGVPRECITHELGDDVNEWKIPISRYWERTVKFSETDNVLTALDTITRLSGLKWKITREGIITLYVPDGSIPEPKYDLTAESVEEIDIITSISKKVDYAQRSNVFAYVGRTAYGQKIWGLLHDGSHNDEEHYWYIGDDWWRVVVDDDNHYPQATCWQDYQEMMKSLVSVEWSWQGHPDLQCGDTVTLNVDHLGIPLGSIIEVVEKNSTITPNSYIENVVGVVVKFAEGGEEDV